MMFRKSLVLGLVAFAIAPAAAQAQTTTVKAIFDSSTDTFKPLNDTHPAGSVKFSQTDNGAITGKGTVSGLMPNRAYLAVPYKDGSCLPTPGVTAFPSAPWTTGSNGSASFSTTVNPQAINPVGQFTLDQTHSVSIREVAVGSQQPPIGPGTPNLPNPITEACDTGPLVNIGD